MSTIRRWLGLAALALALGGCGSESAREEACIQHAEGCQQLNDERKNTEASEHEADAAHEAAREEQRLSTEEG